MEGQLQCYGIATFQNNTHLQTNIDIQYDSSENSHCKLQPTCDFVPIPFQHEVIRMENKMIALGLVLMTHLMHVLPQVTHATPTKNS